MTGETIAVTPEEMKAIRSLQRLAKKWPESLSLFSWSGSLLVMKRGEDGRHCPVGVINGIDNDGGDPSDNEVNQYIEVIYGDSP